MGIKKMFQKKEPTEQEIREELSRVGISTRSNNTRQEKFGAFKNYAQERANMKPQLGPVGGNPYANINPGTNNNNNNPYANDNGNNSNGNPNNNSNSNNGGNPYGGGGATNNNPYGGSGGNGRGSSPSHMHRLHRQLLDHLIHMETIMVLDLVKILLVLMPNQLTIHHILTHRILDQL